MFPVDFVANKDSYSSQEVEPAARWGTKEKEN